MTDLSEILEPPDAPVGCEYDAEWILAKLGVSLPGDYEIFIAEYGAGTVDDFLYVFLPNWPNHNLDLVHQSKELADAIQTIQREQKPGVPYAPFPSPGGLLPWGATDNGDVCFWKTGDPDPNRWPVVVCDAKMLDWEEFRGTMTEFIAKVLSGKFPTKIFPDDFPSESPTFEPLKESG